MELSIEDEIRREIGLSGIPMPVDDEEDSAERRRKQQRLDAVRNEQIICLQALTACGLLTNQSSLWNATVDC